MPALASALASTTTKIVPKDGGRGPVPRDRVDRSARSRARRECLVHGGTMITIRFALVLMIAFSPILDMKSAVAQVPPHTPGTICFTERFWCWADPPGRPGATCFCPSPYGRIQGRLN